MTSSSDARLQWEEQERVDKARRKLENRRWLRDFTVVLVLIVLTITVATVLARLAA